MEPSKKIAKGFSLYLTGDEYVQLFGGSKTPDFVVGFVVAKLKPIFEPTNPPKGTGLPSAPTKEELKAKPAIKNVES